ncbi:hypothetical protein ABB37_09307, partial [Leptomonas pyrrhocoris]
MSSRTHIVDLGMMSREQLIEVAKKQANQIREKNTRISAMETFIEGVTGTSAEESLQRTSSAYAAASTNSSFASDCPHARHPLSHSQPNNDSNASAQLTELRQLLEEEQVQHTLRISALETQLHERQTAYEALQTQVDGWKAKVMTAMTADRERIQQLEGQLATTDALEGVEAAAPPGSTAPKQDDEEAESTRLELQSQVAFLTAELQATRTALQQATDQLQRRLSPPMTPREASGNTAEAALAAEPAKASSPPVSQAIIDPTQIPPEVLNAAVHDRLETWKERAKATLMREARHIEELEAQLAATQQERDSEAEALRADVARLEAQLAAAQ